MKTKVATVKEVEFRVWCEHCSIRIAPNEETIARDGKTYHQRCYSKYCAAHSKTEVATAATAATARTADVAGNQE